MSHGPLCKAKRVLAALLGIGWRIKRQSGSRRTLARDGWSDYVFAFHDGEEAGALDTMLLKCAGAQLAGDRYVSGRGHLPGRARFSTDACPVSLAPPAPPEPRCGGVRFARGFSCGAARQMPADRLRHGYETGLQPSWADPSREGFRCIAAAQEGWLVSGGHSREPSPVQALVQERPGDGSRQACR